MTRTELLTIREAAKAAMTANRTPETMQAYVDACNAHGDWMAANGVKITKAWPGGGSKAGKRQTAERAARYAR